MNIVILMGANLTGANPSVEMAKLYVDMLKDKHSVSVIFPQTSDRPYHGEVVDGFKTYTISSLGFRLEKKVGACFPTSHKKRKIVEKLYFPFKAMRSICCRPSGMKWYIGAAKRALAQISKKEAIDVIISVCIPFSAHVAAYQWKEKHPETKWITYTIDPYYVANVKIRNALVRFTTGKWARKLSVDIPRKADHNLLYEAVCQNEEEFSMYPQDKTEVLYTPLRAQAYKDVCRESSSEYSLYAGGFYPTIRHPGYMLDVYSKLRDRKLYVYSNNTCFDTILDYEKKFDNIHWHPYVERRQLDQLISRAGYLVMVGNSITGYKPSKIFDCISSGKPIINFYKNGLSEPLLQRYPYALQIDCDNTEASDAAEKVAEFIKQNIGKCLSIEEIYRLYPEYDGENIKKHLFSVVEKCVVSTKGWKSSVG